VPYWYNRPEYITAMAELIADKYKEFTPEQQKEGVDVLYSAHGVPKSYITKGDPYKLQMEDCATLISARLGELVSADEAIKVSNGGGMSRVDTLLPGSNGTFLPRIVTTTDPPLSSSSSSSSSSMVVKNLRCQLAFQSRVGPVEWLRPYTDDKLREMGAGGGAQGKVKNLIVVPVAFVSEHIETLEEIDIEYRSVYLFIFIYVTGII
jgi:ferrochelatase